MPKELIVGISL
jgi:hypothetical protein